ncbi:MAG: hypothetical protein LBU70_00040 [Chitinispirillales bacterium]|nr:hypothetical protein [Chitinispirillales bacterium]
MKKVKNILIAATIITAFSLGVSAQTGQARVPDAASSSDSTAVVASRDTQSQQPARQAGVQRPTRRTTNWSKIKTLFE